MEIFSTRPSNGKFFRDSTGPAVSVLMPVRDVEPFVARAVRSVLAGTEDLELVVVDDGSRDETSRVVYDAAGNDPRLVLIPSEREGIVAALQRGLEFCRGRYLARMDGDDWCDPLRFVQQRRFLDANPQIAVVGCLVTAHPQPPLGTGLRRYLDWQNSLVTHEQMFADRYIESVLSHATAMFRRDVLDDVGGWRDAGWSEDMDLWLRLMDRGVRFAKLEQYWYHWRIRPQAATWSDERCFASAMLAGKLQHLLRGPLGRGKQVEVWGVGRSLERWADAFEDRGLDVEPVSLDRSRLHDGAVPRPRGRPAVACYASARRRAMVRRLAADAGWREGRNLFFVA